MKAAHILASAAMLASFATPGQAQDRSAEVKALTDEIARARATLDGLEKRLNKLNAPPAVLAAPDKPVAATGKPPVDLTEDEPAKVRAIADAGWTLAPPGPVDRPMMSPRDGAAAAFELAAGTGGGRASFALTRSSEYDTGKAANGSIRTRNDTVGLVFSAPLSKEGDTPFATLDGLASGTKLEFEFTRFSGRIPTQDSIDSLPAVQNARRRCRESMQAYTPGCVRLNSEFVEKFMTDEEKVHYQNHVRKNTLQRSFAWSLRAAVGYDEFAFYPVPALAKTTAERVSFSAGSSIAFFPMRHMSVAMDFDYARSFKAKKPVTTCPLPAAGATNVSCVPGPLLGPDQTDQLIIAPEIRYLIKLGDTGLVRTLGLAPRIEADLLTGDLAFDFPVYFAADEKNGLIGGLRFGYLTNEKDFKFGIFVGKRFSIFR